jgi:serine/threonine-protein kinase
MSGQILRGHYQIVRALSSGGFGQTFLAQDTDIPGNPVCVVKQLKPLSQTPAHLEVARQLFEREAQKLTLLGNHDQIPRLLAYFKENNEFYLVQEYIEGHTLDVELPLGQRWTEAQVIDLLQQMLTVLVYVHDEGVIHRDIKPANIIRRKRDNKLVLIDFGAVKEMAQPGGIPGQPMTVATGTQIGTAGYMPTEQGRGKPKPSSDLYALGMIGIQALTGRYPHQLEEDPNTGETVWQNLTQVTPGLAQVLTQMTRYHFKDRYQSAVEALQAVRKLAPTSSGTTPSGTAPTVAATQMAMETVQELTLEWTEQGQTRTQIIRPQQPTKFPGRVRVGRDPAQCDIVLSNPTVSALHIEIVFDSQRFLVRNLRENNPLYINGQPLSQGEAALHQGSVLRLGEAEVRVTSITQRQYPVGSVPSGSFSTSQPSSPQPVAPTVQAGRSSASYQMNTDEYAAKVSGEASSSGSTPVNPPKPPGKKNRLWYGLLSTLILVGFNFYRAYDRSQKISPQTSSPSSLSSSSTNSSSSSSSSSTSVSTAKARCGDASIDNKYPFYRVLIDNAGSDVQDMLRDIRTRFCGDAQIAGKGIQIAAFQNRERADEFVRFMKQYYPNTVSVEITPY